MSDFELYGKLTYFSCYVTGPAFISAFASLIAIYVYVANSVVGIKICPVTAV